ncbi:MAG: twin-arginine translocation pathway signal protein [Acidobacteriota bacterium]|nr:twin-arginine translocation pathway signal protein [Acidobacteriota bacterium]
MTNDDDPRGIVLSRREAITLLGLSSAGLLTACAPWEAHGAPAGSCIALPEQTEGPFFADNMPKRSDIRAGRPGAPLQLTLNVLLLEKTGCAPLPGAHVDLWQCDAQGVYSDDTFLRGYQLTDASGTTEFTTIVPGFYSGRTVHIHFKIRSNPDGPRGYELASQLYFDEAITQRIHAREPYASRAGRRVPNQRDSIYRNGGDQLTLALGENGNGFHSTFNVVMRAT